MAHHGAECSAGVPPAYEQEKTKAQRKAGEGGEQPPAGFLLSVNGRDYEREILKLVCPGH